VLAEQPSRFDSAGDCHVVEAESEQLRSRHVALLRSRQRGHRGIVVPSALG
jgi:hypothetical protein